MGFDMHIMSLITVIIIIWNSLLSQKCSYSTTCVHHASFQSLPLSPQPSLSLSQNVGYSFAFSG